MPTLNHINSATVQEVLQLIQLLPIATRGLYGTIRVYKAQIRDFFTEQEVSAEDIQRNNIQLGEYMAALYSNSLSHNDIQELNDYIRNHHLLFTKVKLYFMRKSFCPKNMLHIVKCQKEIVSKCRLVV